MHAGVSMYEGLPVQTVYLRTPFLPPNQRTLKQDQIGPSSHKHDYDAGVLLGNWVEERSAAMRKFTKLPLENATTYKDTYAEPRNPGRPTPTGPVEVGRTLLFSHGRDLDTPLYTTTNELFFTHGRGVHNMDGSVASVADILDSSINSTSSRRGFVDKKRDQWKASMVNEAATRYHTTKSSTIDAAANCVLEDPGNHLVSKQPPQKWGSSVRELNLTQRNLGLRNPIPMMRSPLRAN